MNFSLELIKIYWIEMNVCAQKESNRMKIKSKKKKKKKKINSINNGNYREITSVFGKLQKRCDSARENGVWLTENSG